MLAFATPSPSGAPFAASVCCHVACGEAEGRDELLEGAGVCVHGDGRSAPPDQPTTESTAPPRPKSQGQQQFVSQANVFLSHISSNTIYWHFQLILELCKGSALGEVDAQGIQSYLERLPVSSADVSFKKLLTV